jgi:hypothetical protein
MPGLRPRADRRDLRAAAAAGDKLDNCADTSGLPACTGTGQTCGGGGLADLRLHPDPTSTHLRRPLRPDGEQLRHGGPVPRRLRRAAELQRRRRPGRLRQHAETSRRRRLP